ncbi:MAG: hypothetical protein ABL878_00650 [Burkholderiales bacterium]
MMHSFFRLSRHLVVPVFFVTGILASASSISAAADAMQVTTEAFQESVVKNKDGKPEKKREPVKTAMPGTEVIYVITYRNTGDKPAEKVVVNNPVPEHLAYIPGSAQGAGTRIEFSVDKGKQFGALETLRVKAANGVTRVAKGEDVTHVRWMVMAPVSPGASDSVTYKAVIK